MIREREDWRPSHELVAESILQQLIAEPTGEIESWTQGLADWCITTIEVLRDSAGPLGPDERIIEVARRLFVARAQEGVAQLDASSYARLIEDIPSDEGRSRVFAALTGAFPDVAHFWAHRGRFLASELRDFEEARACAQQAIELERNDSALHHMRGVILRTEAYELMLRRPATALGEIEDVTDEALSAFEKARDLSPQEDYGYVSAIELQIRLIRYAAAQDGGSDVVSFLSTMEGARFQGRLNDAEHLLMQVRRLREGRQRSGYVDALAPRFDEIYGDHASAIQAWTNLLARPDVRKAPVRRAIVNAYLARRDREWTALSSRELTRIRDLMESNLADDPANGRDTRLWFQAAKRSDANVVEAIERLTYWADKDDSLEANYYLFCLRTLQALDGDAQAKAAADKRAERCRALARDIPNRSSSFEWLGTGLGIAKLVSALDLGGFDPRRGFFEDASQLVRVSGNILLIRGPGSGEIELRTGQRAFFVPVRGRDGAFERDRDETADVSFHLGFSYDGLRAWEVART